MVNSTPVDYLPIIIQLLVVLGFVGLTIVATHLLGPKRKTKDKLEVFECGIESVGNARSPFSIKYFLVAILFVLFDVEIIFMYPWAVNFKDMSGDMVETFLQMFVFLAVVLLGFVYVIKKGILKWE
jgi:NADH-quinone oxidoreductase subunit A